MNILKIIRESRIYKSQAGQMLVIFALTWMIFAGGLLTVYNTGTLVGERIRLQNAADSAAYSGAVWEARALNYIAYSNRTIIAELSFISWLCAITSCVKGWRKLVEVAASIPFPPTMAILNAVKAVLVVIENILENVVLNIPWKYLPQGIGMLQVALNVVLQSKIRGVMADVAEGFDSDIKINDYYYTQVGLPFILTNLYNHQSVVKDGEWEGLKKVLKDTIGRYTKGVFNGEVPIYNRDFELWMPPFFKWLKIPGNTGAVIKMDGSVDITKTQVKCSDGPGVKVGTWSIAKDLSLYIAWWFNLSIDIANVEVDIDLDDISYYVFDKDKNQSVGVYANAGKHYSNMSDLLFKNINGLFGAKERMMQTSAKARAVYEDPVSSSKRHESLKAAGLEPNLFNPFWKAELVPFKTDAEEDGAPGYPNAAITYAMGYGPVLGTTLKRH